MDVKRLHGKTVFMAALFVSSVFSAVYYTQLGERITKPYWVGSIESEPVTIIVE